MKLNLGCGKNIQKGWINVDAVKIDGVDIVCDLNKFPWPFDDDSVDTILMDNILEHLDDVVKVMEEVYRILKVNGNAEIIVPYYKSKNAYKDPTHKHFFTEETMNYFTCWHPCSFYSTARFRIITCEKYHVGGFPLWHLKKYLGISLKVPFLATSLRWVLEKVVNEENKK